MEKRTSKLNKDSLEVAELIKKKGILVSELPDFLKSVEAKLLKSTKIT